MKKVCGYCQVKGVDRCIFWEGGGGGGGGGGRLDTCWRFLEFDVLTSCEQ